MPTLKVWDGSAWVEVKGDKGDPGEVTNADLESRVAPIEGDISAIDTRVTGVEDTSERLDSRALDVKAFGAVGDGTTDYTVETAAIQNAIDAAAGRWVVIPPGTYDVGTIAVTSSARIRLEEGAVLRKRPGSHSEDMFAFSGDSLIIRGPGVIDGNRHNVFNPSTGRAGRPRMVAGPCPSGAVIDIEDVHFRSIMLGVVVTNFGGYVNFSRNTVTDHGQHLQVTGGITTIVTISSGEIGAASPLLRTNFNRAIFTDTEDAPGTAPGGIFVSSHDGTTIAEGNPVHWEAIGNYFYGYGQNYAPNEIGCLHSYPAPHQVRVVANHFENFPVTPVSMKSVTDFICTDNIFLNDRTSDRYIPNAGTVLYAPGYHADTVQHFRAVIANNIIDNSGGNSTQGAHGIVVNAIAESVARDVVITGNSIRTGGTGISLNHGRNIHVADNVIRAHAGPPGSKRGIGLANISGDVAIIDNLIHVIDQGIYAVSSTNVNARVWIKGNLVKTPSIGMDIRGVKLAVIDGNTVERSGGGTAINVTSYDTNTVRYLYYDRTNVVLEGSVVLNFANINTFEGQEPLTGAPSVNPGGAAGSGATASIDGDGDKGTITLTTGTGASTGGLASFSFPGGRRVPPIITLTPGNAAAAGKTSNIYIGSVSTNSFILSATGTALSDNTTHIWHYRLD